MPEEAIKRDNNKNCDEDDELEIDLGFIELDEKDLEFLGIYISVCEALEK